MFLLDTHTLLWYLHDSAELPESTKSLINNAREVCTSIVSLGEIAIKSSLGKLVLECSIQQIEELCIRKDIGLLHLSAKDMDILKTLPEIHKDPFDRMLVSQAISTCAIIITKDANVAKYPVRTLW